MTAKDKAEELVNKFIKHTQEWDELDGYVNDIYRAKQCALIAVDEMINWKETLFVTEGSMAYQYLLKVKQEIQNL
jgi:uncharacterized UPF0160 family protein